MNRTSLVLALVVPALLGACGAGENTVGTDWPDAGSLLDTSNTPDTSFPSDPCSHCTPGAAQLTMSRRGGCPTVAEGTPGQAMTFDITNTGSVASRALSTNISNAPGAPLVLITSDTCTGSTLGPGATCTVVIFAANPFTTITVPRIPTLIVSDGQTSSSAPLPVSDDGALTASPAALEFGTVAVGILSEELFVQVTTACKTNWTATLDNPNFVISSNTCTGSVSACQIGVRFAPSAGAGVTFAGFLTVNASDSGSVSVALTGVTSPYLSPAPFMVTPSAFDFGEVMVGQSATGAITVTGTKAAATAVLSGPEAAAFAIVANTCTAATTIEATCTIQIQYAPTVVGPSSTKLYISDSRNMATVTVQGQGFSAPAAAPFTVAPATIDFGLLYVTMSSAPITINVTTPSARTFTATLSDSAVTEVAIVENTCSTLIPAGGTCIIRLVYTPTRKSVLDGALNLSDGSNVATVTMVGVATII